MLVPPPAKKRSGRGTLSAVEPSNGCSIPNVVDRAKTSDRPSGVNVEFCIEKRRKLAVDPSDFVATLMFAVLYEPCDASAELLRRSRIHVNPNPETFVGWLNSRTSSTVIFPFRLLATTCL